MPRITLARVRDLARDCGFELAGATPAVPAPESAFFREWTASGYAGEMGYLPDARRTHVREDPLRLLGSAKSIICVGKTYVVNEVNPTSRQERGRISRYAWGEDYHDVLRRGLETLVQKLRAIAGEFDYKICVDTAPLLERAYARRAGLGWIGRNTCLIDERIGSWFFLGELLVSFEVESGAPPPDRCGTCTRCIDACPTAAIVPAKGESGPEYTLDSRLCISYFTIELRGAVPEPMREKMGDHLFGCDICQDVCPWNDGAPFSAEPAFAPRADGAVPAPALETMAALSEVEFRQMFRGSPVQRARYGGFLRNVAVAMGNRGLEKFRQPLEKLAASDSALIREHAEWALSRLPRGKPAATPRSLP
jgi:epoxyqueuosine reductase